MTGYQRFKCIFEGLVMLFFGLVMIVDTEDGYQLVTVILAISLMLRGLRTVVYYFTMARHMVGGKEIFFRGVVFLDLGIFTGTLTTIPQIYVIVYLLAIHAFSGAVDVMRVLEAKRLESRSWKRGLLAAAVNLAIAVACICCIHNVRLLMGIYCLGLFWSAGVRIVSAFRKTAIVYIQ